MAKQITYGDGSRQAPSLPAPQLAAGRPPPDVGSAIGVAAGDFFRWMEDLWEDVEKSTVLNPA